MDKKKLTEQEVGALLNSKKRYLKAILKLLNGRILTSAYLVKNNLDFGLCNHLDKQEKIFRRLEYINGIGGHYLVYDYLSGEEFRNTPYVILARTKEEQLHFLEIRITYINRILKYA